MPADDWRIIPARSISRCETICASDGVSFNVGRNYWDKRMAENPNVAGPERART